MVAPVISVIVIAGSLGIALKSAIRSLDELMPTEIASRSRTAPSGGCSPSPRWRGARHRIASPIGPIRTAAHGLHRQDVAD
jgi:hypothetical protein